MSATSSKNCTVKDLLPDSLNLRATHEAADDFASAASVWVAFFPPDSSRLGNLHQEPLGLGVLDAVHELAALVHVAHRLGQRDAGLDQHHDAHGEIALHPEIDRQEEHADGDEE